MGANIKMKAAAPSCRWNSLAPAQFSHQTWRRRPRSCWRLVATARPSSTASITGSGLRAHRRETKNLGAEVRRVGDIFLNERCPLAVVPVFHCCGGNDSNLLVQEEEMPSHGLLT